MAPFRAMIQEREWHRRNGVKELGPMAMYFGTRTANEFLYGDEMEAYVKDGLLTDLYCAFSRDQPEKIYVQNRIDESQQLIWDYLGTEKYGQKGIFYLCGPAGPPVEACRKAVVTAFEVAGGLSREEADQMVTQMQITGKYNVEAW